MRLVRSVFSIRPLLSGFNEGMDGSGKTWDISEKALPERFTKMPFEIGEKVATICGKSF